MVVDNDNKAAYLNLLKLSLTDSLWPESWEPIREAPAGRRPKGLPGFVLDALDRVLRARSLCIARCVPLDPEKRAVGHDWPVRAHTMIGLRRLDNLQSCIEQILRDGVPGDLLEAGVWRGGASVFMRAVLRAHGITDRTVWLADSFRGLPPPDAIRYPADRGDWLFTEPYLAVSLAEVRATFERYGLLDGQVRFLEGWFRETLPRAPIQKLALLRLDGDMYESTIDALSSLFPRLVAGGFVVVDDFYLPACRRAVLEFRDRHGITDEITLIDWAGVYWRKS